jgi:hypothetical protein
MPGDYAGMNRHTLFVKLCCILEVEEPVSILARRATRILNE